MRENICDQIDFILKGGLWEKIIEELAKYTSSAIIIEIKNDDIVVMEAVNAELDRLMFKGIGKELLSCSPEVSPIHKLYFDNFSISPIPQLEEWTNVIRFYGKEWNIFVMIRETPSQDLLDILRPYLNVISLWISLRDSAQLEERLSALSYMVLATKNTIASIFEPMSIEYFADFLRSVIKESLFPKKIAIYIDDRISVKLLIGDDFGSPNKCDVFASKIISPVPLIYNAEEAAKLGLNSRFVNGSSIFILPITCAISDEVNYRLFCIGVLDKPAQEKLNFMELLGNVASKALEIIHLRVASEERTKQLDVRYYTVAAFYTIFQKLISYNDRHELLAFLLGFFSESSQADRVKLVVYDSKAGKYFLVGESVDGIAAQCFDPLSENMERISGNGEGEVDEYMLRIWGFKFNDMPKCKVYPFWVEDKLEGFVAMRNIKCNVEIPDFPVVFRMFCQIAAREIHFRLAN